MQVIQFLSRGSDVWILFSNICILFVVNPITKNLMAYSAGLLSIAK